MSLSQTPVATALSIYDRFGYRRDPELEAKASKWLQENRSDKHGTHTYALSDFGLAEEGCASAAEGCGTRSRTRRRLNRLLFA